jgi:uncharacterized protein
MRPSASDIAVQLTLEPHPEGGWFRETYRSEKAVETTRGSRAASTAILFLVTVSSPSRFHRLASDELWVFQAGLPLELITLDAGGAARVRVLGDPAARREAMPQALVPAGAWQAARVAAGRRPGAVAPESDAGRAENERAWSLLSCVVTPGFDFADFELARPADLIALCPEETELILTLT